MKIRFWKYHGAGNDFIMIDNRTGIADSLTAENIRFLCERHFGIGADGLIMLENDTESDFFMRYFNSDGNESTMCGNGGRCIVLFAHHLGIIEKETRFNAIDGMHEASILSETVIRLRMSNTFLPKQISPVSYLIDTGSPHLVVFTDKVNKIDVTRLGEKLRYDKTISERGVNVNFCQINNEEIIFRTYERGVENETLACGTGAVAAAISAVFSRKISSMPVTLNARGGRLQVSFDIDNMEVTNVFLTGAAKKVFVGEIDF